MRNEILARGNDLVVDRARWTGLATSWPWTILVLGIGICAVAWVAQP